MSTRGWALTLGVGFGTAWLVVYEAPDKGKSLNAILGPALLTALALCIAWFVFDPYVKHHYKRALGIPSPSASAQPDMRHAGWVLLQLKGFSGAASAVCEVRDRKGREWRATVKIDLQFPESASRAGVSFPPSFMYTGAVAEPAPLPGSALTGS